MNRLADLTIEYQQHERALDAVRYLALAGTLRTDGPDTVGRAFVARWPQSHNVDVVRKHMDVVSKAVVPPGTTVSPTWAKPLLPTTFADVFKPLIRAASVLATLPAIPVPFGVPVPRVIDTGSFGWVTEAAPKPVTKMTFDSLMLPERKAAGIVVLTEELVRSVVAGTERAMLRSLTGGAGAFVDGTFLSTAAAGAGPAGILAGVVPVAPGADLDDTLDALVAALYAPARKPTAPWWILSAETAGTITRGLADQSLAMLRSWPVAISPAAGRSIIALDTDQLFVADGDVVIATSRQAAIEMENAPSDPIANTVIVDLWSHNLVGYRIERIINWSIASSAVAYAVLP